MSLYIIICFYSDNNIQFIIRFKKQFFITDIVREHPNEDFQV